MEKCSDDLKKISSGICWMMALEMQGRFIASIGYPRRCFWIDYVF